MIVKDEDCLWTHFYVTKLFDYYYFIFFIYFIIFLFSQSTDKQERDRLVLFLNKLINHKNNVREIINSKGMKVLVDLLTLAHMHTTRASLTTQVSGRSFLLLRSVKGTVQKYYFVGNFFILESVGHIIVPRPSQL